MSSNAATTGQALPAVEQDRPKDAPYVRKSSGLVRDVPFLDMFLMNASSSNPVGIAVAYGIFFAMASFPHNNMLLAIVIALALGVFVWVTFALVSATLPRFGGDYLYGSRLLHPIVGMGSNLATYVGSVLASGTAAFFVASVAVGPALTIIGVVSGNNWWVTAGTNVSSGWPAFAIAGGTLVVLAILSLTGTKKIVRVMVWLYGVAFVAFVATLLILLFKTRAGSSTTSTLIPRRSPARTTRIRRRSPPAPRPGYRPWAATRSRTQWERCSWCWVTRCSRSGAAPIWPAR